ncbi:MAG: ParA family protein [Chloroflexota bacterium]
MKIYALYNIKGGVGKTTSAVNLAWLSARDGANTLIWDLDPQGAASYCFRIKPKVKGGRKGLVRGRTQVDDAIKGTDYEGLDLLPADFSYRNMDIELSNTKKPENRFRKLLQPLADEYDAIFLDCPPGLTLSTESVFGAADVLLVPMIPATLSTRTSEQIEYFIDREKIKKLQRLYFYNMVDRRKKLHRSLLEERTQDFLQTTIPYSSAAEQMPVYREPVFAYAPRTAPALAYEALWQEVKERTKK